MQIVMWKEQLQNLIRGMPPNCFKNTDDLICSLFNSAHIRKTKRDPKGRCCQMKTSGAIALLFAEGDTKREQSSAWRAKQCTNDLGHLSHLLPNLNRRGIHIEQSHLLATVSPKTINADCR